MVGTMIIAMMTKMIHFKKYDKFSCLDCGFVCWYCFGR
jgi:hypothetical protein